MDNPKISVIVPVYKVEPYLRRCIDSIVNQTYKNLEIILVDDGSPDNCGAICDEYAARDDRIIAIHKENGGVSSARNVGLDVATGEWIGFVDADDWIEQDMYEYLYNKGISQNADVVQCGLFIDEKDDYKIVYCPLKENILDGSSKQYKRKGWMQISNSACNKLYRAQLLREHIYDAGCSMGEDFLFNLLVLRDATCVLLCNQAKYHYVQHESSVCHTLPDANTLRNYRLVLKQASTVFRKGSVEHMFFESARLKIDMHNCSRMIQFPKLDIVQLKDDIRKDFRRETFRMLRVPFFTAKERGKLLLIGWNWWMYRILVVKSKK